MVRSVCIFWWNLWVFIASSISECLYWDLVLWNRMYFTQYNQNNSIKEMSSWNTWNSWSKIKIGKRTLEGKNEWRQSERKRSTGIIAFKKLSWNFFLLFFLSNLSLTSFLHISTRVFSCVVCVGQCHFSISCFSSSSIFLLCSFPWQAYFSSVCEVSWFEILRSNKLFLVKHLVLWFIVC